MRATNRSKLMRVVTALSIVGCVSGCAETLAMKAASTGDIKTLAREIDVAERAGEMSTAKAARLASRVLHQELTAASEKEAPARVRDVAACAVDLKDALRTRMDRGDRAAAEAALVLVDTGGISDEEARELGGRARSEGMQRATAEGVEAWRAVRARGLTRGQDGQERRAALLDPSDLVRRHAARASASAGEAADIEPLSDVARLDPSPMVRSESVRALVGVARRIDAPPVTEQVMRRLRDLWTAADDAIREDLAVAYAMPPLAHAGGAIDLRGLIARGEGSAAISGAAAVLRAEAAAFDAPLRASAWALLIRSMREGSRPSREHAVAVIPLTDDALRVLREIASREDVDARVGALDRLTESSADRASALQELERIAAGIGVPASRAKLALSRAGDVRVQAWLEHDLRASSAGEKLLALDGLVALGRAGRGAPLLADADASVRTRAACRLLVAVRLGR